MCPFVFSWLFFFGALYFLLFLNVLLISYQLFAYAATGGGSLCHLNREQDIF
jgi:hypothetical protein